MRDFMPILVIIVSVLLLVSSIMLDRTSHENHQLQKENSKLIKQEVRLNKKIKTLNKQIKKIQRQIVSQEKKKHTQMSYEPYTAITDTSSPNYEYSVCRAYTDNNGLRKIDDCYCVALPPAYGTKIGAKYRVQMSTGISFKVILSDQKSPSDCINNGTIGADSSQIEFLVDTNALPSDVQQMGSISYLDNFEGNIKSIEKI